MTTDSTPAQADQSRFTVFAGTRSIVLRDRQTGTDYPFSTINGAHRGARLLREKGNVLMGSPSDRNVYGTTKQAVEYAE